MAKLSAAERDALPKEAFAIPETRSYPIHNENHARNALARVAQNGTPEEKKRVRAAVKKRYPDIGEEADYVDPETTTAERIRISQARKRRG